MTIATDITNQASVTTIPYTMGELMVATAAREIRDGEVVFVGMRMEKRMLLPSIRGLK